MHRVSNFKLVWKGLFLLAFFSLAFYLARQAPESEVILALVTSYGYFGIFFISVVSGFNLVVPVPAIAFMPLFMEAGLSYWTTILVITAGVTLADTTAFFLATIGKLFIKDGWGSKIFLKLESLGERYKVAPYIVMFLFASLAPLPNELVLIPMALMGYRYRYILPVILLGNLVFEILYSQGLLGVYYTI